MNYAESGLFIRLYNGFEMERDRVSQADRIPLFGTEEAYMEEYSNFSNLCLDNFHYILIFYAIAGSLAIVAFAVHHLVKFIRKVRKRKEEKVQTRARPYRFRYNDKYRYLQNPLYRTNHEAHTKPL